MQYVVKLQTSGCAKIDVLDKGNVNMNDTINADINKKWRKRIWNVSLALAIVIVAAEGILFLSNNRVPGSKLGTVPFFVVHILVPLFIFAISLVGTYYVLKKEKLSDNACDWMLAILVYIILSVPAYGHFHIISLVLLPTAAIAVTAIFASYSITFTVMLLVISSCITNAIRFFQIYEVEGSGLGGYIVTSLLVVGSVSAATFLVNMHTNELMESIDTFAVKQMNLMTKLKKDPLTGLYNRRSFEESLEEKILQTEKMGEKAYIAIFDIDHFKNVNDTYGHSNGDVVIKALCKMIKEKSKEHGLAFRYGGEEFVILFSDIELPKVMNVVEDIRTEFRCYYFQFMNDSGITCSCGIAEYIKGESAKAWFNRADSALYRAKEAGRNRTVISEQGEMNDGI